MEGPGGQKREAYEVLHANLAKLQQSTCEFSRQLQNVRAVADASNRFGELSSHAMSKAATAY